LGLNNFRKPPGVGVIFKGDVDFLLAALTIDGTA
jgi:hypothetical protein